MCMTASDCIVPALMVEKGSIPLRFRRKQARRNLEGRFVYLACGVGSETDMSMDFGSLKRCARGCPGQVRQVSDSLPFQQGMIGG
jgi:hypothetical protein